MELVQILRILRRWWWLVLIPVAITVVLALPGLLNRGATSGTASGAVSGGFSQTISYTAMQQLDAIPRADGDYQDIWLSSELTVNAFTDWVRSGSFKAEIAELVPDLNPDALGIAADNAHSVGQIYLSYPTSDGLDAIGSAAVQVLETRSQPYFPQLGGKPADVSVLSKSGIVAAPPPLTDRFGALIKIGLGLIAGLGLAFLAHYLDPVLRRREDVESLGLPVVGAIPRK